LAQALFSQNPLHFPPSSQEIFEFDGGETSIVVAAPMPPNLVNLFVSLMGTLWYEGKDFTITGQTLNFNLHSQRR
jgi:hypothetical protein